MKKILASVLMVLIGIVIILSCNQYRTTISDIFVRPTEKEIYLRQFEGDSVFLSKWYTIYLTAKDDSLQVDLPYQEHINVSDSSFIALSYLFRIEEGTSLSLTVSPKDSLQKVFYSIYDSDDVENPIEEGFFQQRKNTTTFESNGKYKIVLQPMVKKETYFDIALEPKSNYKFPVADSDNKAIQSFWAAPRDGGKRSHQGIDIFAKLGTPVIAATSGYITYTGEKGLGGKQVWLRDGILGNSLYYAHLDSINEALGYKVKQGDTLGFVGNTGNARTTSPHLHFGIYKSRKGAVDPLEYIKLREKLVSESNISLQDSYSIRSKANVRLGPSTSYNKKVTLNKTDSIKVIGKTKDWFRIIAKDSIQGFIHKSLIK